jgi:hypothetical protein
LPGFNKELPPYVNYVILYTTTRIYGHAGDNKVLRTKAAKILDPSRQGICSCCDNVGNL